MTCEASLVNGECGRFVWLVPVMVFCVSNLLPSYLLAQTTISAPQDVQVFDTPNDGGGSLTVQWAPAPGDRPDTRYQVLVGEATATDPATFTIIAEFPADTKYVKDVKTAWWTRGSDKTWHQAIIKSAKGIELEDNTPYAVAVATVREDRREFSPLHVTTPATN